MAMTMQQLDAADKETTGAYRGGRRFDRRLALLDLQAYGEDHIRPHVKDLAARWRWTETRVRALVKPHQVAPGEVAAVT